MSDYRQYRPPEKMPSVLLHLILINVIVFFAFKLPQLAPYYNYLVAYSFFDPAFRPWQALTHMFAHGNEVHLFFNMFALFMFGRTLTSVWDSRRFLFFYFTCGLTAFFAHEIYLYIVDGMHPAFGSTGFLGASGAVYGVVVAFATLFPNARVLLLIPPIPLKAKYMVALLIAFDFFMGISGAHSGIAHFAHLGGGLGGFLLVRYWQKNSKTFY